MKRLLGFLLFLFLCVLLALPTSSFSTSRGIRVTAKQGQSVYLYKDYYALVVGISNYEKWPKLPNAVKDAKEVAEKLKELGFEVRLVLDPTSREMKTALGEMVYKMGREENRALLFYYAGHGETETLADKTKMGYIVPRDAPLLERDPMGFATHAISMRDIESASLRIRAKHVMMLFDSCFSGSLFALVRAVPDDITEKSALPVRQYITAGREDEQVPDKSMFKRSFLIALEGDADLTGDGYITGSELGMYLSDKVVNYTHRRQHPQYGKINNPDLDRGDFIFVPLKVRQTEIAEERKHREERSAIAEELGRLREERKKSEELVEQMKRLLEAKWQSEEKSEKALVEKRDLEKDLKRAAKDRQTSKDQMDAKVKQIEAGRKAAEERLQKELAEKKLLEEKLKVLKAEMEKTSQTVMELQSKQVEDERLAYVPKTAKSPYDKLRHGQGPFVIDDFEDRDLWSINFDDKWKDKTKGPANMKISVDTTQGANGTFSSMKIEYKLSERSLALASIGLKGVRSRINEVEMDRSRAYDLSRFNKITFYLKGGKKKTFFSRPNKLFVTFACYGKRIRASYGNKYADYYNRTEIIPDKEWKRVEIPLDDLVPSARTKHKAVNYSTSPDLHNVLWMHFMFSSFKGQDGSPGSNTVWIDEITLE